MEPQCDAYGEAAALSTPLCGASASLADLLNGVSLLPSGLSCAAHCGQSNLRCAAACTTKAEEDDLICSCTGVWLEGSCSVQDGERLCACTAAASTELRSLLSANNPAPRPADEFVERALEASADPACTQPLDATAGLGPQAVREAAARLRRCGFVVLRGALALPVVEAAARGVGSYVRALRANASSALAGGTSRGEVHFVNSLQPGRWELLLPEEFAAPALLLRGVARTALSHWALLGPQLRLHSLGAAISEPGAPAQHWHRDAPPLFAGAAALPPHAVTLLAPLLDVSAEHGPTQLCIGSHHTYGLGPMRGAFVAARNLTLRALAAAQLASVAGGRACEAGGLRVAAPALRRGDALLVDYALRHRGGPNTSPHHRALLYATYARAWYEDSGFGEPWLRPRAVAAVKGGDGGGGGGDDAGCSAPQFAPEALRERGDLEPTELAELRRMTHRARFAAPRWPCDAAAGDSAEGGLQGGVEGLSAPLLPLEPPMQRRADVTEAVKCAASSGAVLGTPWILDDPGTEN